MKITSVLLVSLVLVPGLVLTACSGAQTTTGTPTEQEEEVLFTGSAADIMEQILERAGLDQGTFEEAVDAENSQSYTGLDYQDLMGLAEDAFASQAQISVVPHLLVVIKGKDKAAASELGEQIAANFDSHRWVCVMPDQSFVVTAGQYLLLASTNNEDAALLKAAFSELAGNGADEPNQFFMFSAE